MAIKTSGRINKQVPDEAGKNSELYDSQFPQDFPVHVVSTLLRILPAETPDSLTSRKRRTDRLPNVDLMVGQRRRRWPTIKTALGKRSVFAGQPPQPAVLAPEQDAAVGAPLPSLARSVFTRGRLVHPSLVARRRGGRRNWAGGGGKAD